MKACSTLLLDTQHAHASTGTFFVPRNILSEDIPTRLIATFTPSPLGSDVLKAGIDKMVSLYPDDPSAGSPFGTGNQTFGAGAGFKRAAAICKSS